MTATPWTSAARDRIREAQNNLLAMADWAKESNADAKTLEMLLSPHRALIESLFEQDLPLAKLVDESDLLLHVSGTSATGPTPKVSVLAHILTTARDQVSRLAKQIGEITTVRLPPDLDMAFTGVAGGSLFVGFSVDDTARSEITRGAIRKIAEASLVVSEKGTVNDLARTIQDPASRDMALAAVRHLSPSGHKGISEIELLGKQVHRQISLTIETRRQARGIMSQRVVEKSPPVVFVGTVREVDLDASRFEIRNVEGHPGDIRCAHELDEEDVKRLVDTRVRVKGTPEYGPKDSVRLLWVDEVEPLD